MCFKSENVHNKNITLHTILYANHEKDYFNKNVFLHFQHPTPEKQLDLLTLLMKCEDVFHRMLVTRKKYQ